MEQYTDFHRRAIAKVRTLWRAYIVNNEREQWVQLLDSLPEELLVIGTGRHELYKKRSEFLEGVIADQLEAKDICFQLQDEWYDIKAISDDVCLVYGSIWIREKPTPGKAVLVDMEGSRFTVICRDTGEDVQLCSLHHSMPYVDQGMGEYYPKSLVSLVDEAVKKNEALERRMELDHMTGLYNRVYMEWHVSRAMPQGPGVFFTFDLDDFKQVNDTKGHPAGDRVIQAFAGLLRTIFGPMALLGRMGGDEFAAWYGGTLDEGTALARFEELRKGCRDLSRELDAPISCSAGIALRPRREEGFAELYQRTDRALYDAKAKGKGRLSWAE